MFHYNKLGTGDNLSYLIIGTSVQGHRLTVALICTQQPPSARAHYSTFEPHNKSKC